MLYRRRYKLCVAKVLRCLCQSNWISILHINTHMELQFPGIVIPTYITTTASRNSYIRLLSLTKFSLQDVSAVSVSVTWSPCINWITLICGQDHRQVVRMIYCCSRYSLTSERRYGIRFCSNQLLKKISFCDESFIHHVTLQQLNCLNEEATILVLLNYKPDISLFSHLNPPIKSSVWRYKINFIDVNHKTLRIYYHVIVHQGNKRFHILKGEYL